MDKRRSRIIKRLRRWGDMLNTRSEGRLDADYSQTLRNRATILFARAERISRFY